MALRITTLFLWLLLVGCGNQVEAPRASCVKEALRQPDLRNGVAAFTGTDGRMILVHTGWRGNFRLATNRPYRAASLTKPLLAMNVRQQVATGRIDLDSTIPSLLPSHSFSGDGVRGIAVRHLLQHTAGFEFPRGLDPLWYRDDAEAPRVDCAAASRYVLAFPVRSHPGERVQYSNAGYCLMAEILLQLDAENGESISDPVLREAFRSPYGGAGGWTAPLPSIYAGLFSTLPIESLPSPPEPLPDGSWYGYGWRWWPEPHAGAPWTHTGRLDGLLSIALTDGREQLLVAHFDGDPSDYQATSEKFGKEAWACLKHDMH